jgi:hypothetical protein
VLKIFTAEQSFWNCILLSLFRDSSARFYGLGFLKDFVFFVLLKLFVLFDESPLEATAGI